MEISSVISPIVETYISPKMPIYKIQYTHVKKLDDDELDIDIRVKERIVEVVPKFTSKCRLRLEITEEEYKQKVNELTLDDFHKLYSKQGHRTEEHIYPEKFGHWKWLDGYYEEELEEKQEIYFSYPNKSGHRYYENIKPRLFDKSFTKVSQKFIDLVIKEKRNTYFDSNIYGDKFVITGIERLA